MDRYKAPSLDAEIERYTQQMMSRYIGPTSAQQEVPLPPPAAPLPVTPLPVTPLPVTPVSKPEPMPMPEAAAPPPPMPTPALTPEEEYARFSAANPQRGNIKTQAFTARGTYPVKDVTVVISKMFESGEYIISTQKTDIAGKTEPVSVPAPNVDLSEAPGQTMTPFATYKVTFTHPTFATVVSKQLPVFSGTTAMQTVNLMPLSTNPGGSSSIEYITTEPSDL